MRRRIMGLLYLAVALFFVLSLFSGWFVVRFLSHGGEYVMGFLESAGARITAGAGDGGSWWGVVEYPNGTADRLVVLYRHELFANPANSVAVTPQISYVETDWSTRIYECATPKWTIDIMGTKSYRVVEQSLLSLDAGRPTDIGYSHRLYYCRRLVQTDYVESLDFISRHAPYLQAWAELRRIVLNLWAYVLAIVRPGLAEVLEYAWVIVLSSLSVATGRAGWLSLRQEAATVPH